jgi:hypothetical protein
MTGQNKVVRRNTYNAEMTDHTKGSILVLDNEAQKRAEQKKVVRRNTYNAEMVDHTKALDNEHQRWTTEQATKKQRRTSKRRKDEDYDRVVMGTRIDEDHVNFVLMYNMLTGIRVGVCNAMDN